MNKQQRIWTLLSKQLAGTLTPTEGAELEALAQGKDKEALTYMLHVLKDYMAAVRQAPEIESIQQTRDRNKARVMDILAKEQTADHSAAAPAGRLFRTKRYWWVAAAVGLLLLGVGYYFYYCPSRSPGVSLEVVTTAQGSKSQLTLPDGTEVWLNVNSRLSYPSDFKSASLREVTLSGEAYFKVKHDSDHPFIIHTRYLNIRDLGTAFNVRAYPEEDRSEASLLEGAITVSLNTDPANNLHLQPGEKILYYAGDHKLVKDQSSKPPSEAPLSPLPHRKKLEVARIHPVVVRPGDTIVSEIAWMNDQLVFNDEAFASLAERMSRYFNTEIVIKDQVIADYSFTGIFEGESLQQALKELQMIRPFHFTIDNQKVIIKR